MTVVAAVDRTEGARSVVSEAASLADALACQLRVVHVMPQSEYIDIEWTNAEREGDVLELDELRERAAAVAADVAGEVTEEFEPVGLVGKPGRETLRYLEENDAEFLVVGGRKRSPVGKALFGSVTQSLLLDSPIPVVTVRREAP
jgi:nucleotide-binding universal stress UspA family protein